MQTRPEVCGGEAVEIPFEEAEIPRLIVCSKCRTIDEIPSEPDDIEYYVRRHEPEPLLLRAMAKHDHGVMRIGGKDPEILVMQVDDTAWTKPDNRTRILAELKKNLTGFEPEFYATRDTFKEDAMRCFNLHQRPKEGCIDYQDDSRLLTPASWLTEKPEKLSKREKDLVPPTRKPVYLCHFCPVQSHVTTQQRVLKQLYKEN